MTESLILHTERDESMAKYVLDRLLFWYPGHAWVVQSTASQGHLTIRNPSISYTHGMRMILPEYLSPSDLDKKIMRHAGEFLERFDVKRQKADLDETAERWTKARFR